MDKDQYEIVKGAMNIHAQNVSLMFHEWMQDNKYRRMHSGLYSKVSGATIFTIKELYNKFTQEIISNVRYS